MFEIIESINSIKMKYLLLINAIVYLVKAQKKINETASCANPEFYNPTVYYCDTCPKINEVQFLPNITSCIPPFTHQYSFSESFISLCDDGKEATEDRRDCIKNNLSTLYHFNNNTCKNSEKEQYVRVDKNQLGQYLTEVKCVKIPYPYDIAPSYPKDLCPEFQYYSKTDLKCQCAPEEDQNNQTCGNVCIPQASLTPLSNFPKANAINFNYQSTEADSKTNIDTISNTPSAGTDLIEDTFEAALVNCANDIDQESCQTLANLCVLHMYDPTKSPCLFFFTKGDYKADQAIGKSTNVPWLYYKYYNPDGKTFANAFDPAVYLRNTKKIPFEVSFDVNNLNAQKVYRLDFYLAKWDLKGKFYGMNLISNELIQCTNTYNDAVDFRSFGSSLTNECEINLSMYLNRTYTMYFYEMYLLNPLDGSFIDIPVLIDGITNIAGTTNLNSQAPMSQWILARRFFIFDNLSGLNTALSYRNNVAGEYIRFAKNITLKVEMQNFTDQLNGEQSRIFLPYLYIRYVAKAATIQVQRPNSWVAFTSEYFMDVSNFLYGAMIVFIIMNILVVIVLVARMYVWTKLNPSKLSPDNYSLWFLAIGFSKLFKYWGLFMFFFVWGVSAYWYIFFKMQYRPYVLLPRFELYFDVYRSFDILFGIAAAVFGLHMFHRIYEQTNYDIFFIDWEHDKDILVNNMGEDFRTDKYRGAWRGIHIANQFNQLQKQRTISMSFTFLWLIMLWYYQNTSWKNYANAVPTVSYVEKSPNNYILQFFISTFILFVAGMTQFIIVRLLQLWLPLRKTEFLDLCCVANISLFILDQSLHGYYIHGQSPLGKSDTNLDELVKFLEEEGKGKIRGRGVTDDQNDSLQSYEIFLSYNMRTIYDGLYYLQTQSIIDQAQNADKLHNQSRLTSIFQYIPKSLNIKHVYLLNNYMNSQLKGKIEAVASQSKIFIKEKTFLERFLDFPPSIDLTGSEAKEIVLYKDPNSNFDEVLFSGMEFEWLILTIFWFQMWSIALRDYGRSFPLAIFLTFICERILFKCRIFFGEKNVAKKAVIDNRFFS